MINLQFISGQNFWVAIMITCIFSCWVGIASGLKIKFATSTNPYEVERLSRALFVYVFFAIIEIYLWEQRFEFIWFMARTDLDMQMNVLANLVAAVMAIVVGGFFAWCSHLASRSFRAGNFPSRER